MAHLVALPNPSVANISSGATVCRWSPDGNYLATGNASAPYLTLFKRTGETLSEIVISSVVQPNPLFGGSTELIGVEVLDIVWGPAMDGFPDYYYLCVSATNVHSYFYMVDKSDDSVYFIARAIDPNDVWNGGALPLQFLHGSIGSKLNAPPMTIVGSDNTPAGRSFYVDHTKNPLGQSVPGSEDMVAALLLSGKFGSGSEGGACGYFEWDADHQLVIHSDLGVLDIREMVEGFLTDTVADIESSASYQSAAVHPRQVYPGRHKYFISRRIDGENVGFQLYEANQDPLNPGYPVFSLVRDYPQSEIYSTYPRSLSFSPNGRYIVFNDYNSSEAGYHSLTLGAYEYSTSIITNLGLPNELSWGSSTEWCLDPITDISYVVANTEPSDADAPDCGFRWYKLQEESILQCFLPTGVWDYVGTNAIPLHVKGPSGEDLVFKGNGGAPLWLKAPDGTWVKATSI